MFVIAETLLHFILSYLQLSSWATTYNTSTATTAATVVAASATATTTAAADAAATTVTATYRTITTDTSYSACNCDSVHRCNLGHNSYALCFVIKPS